MDIFMWMSLRRVDKGRSSWRRCCASHFCWTTREGSGCATRSWTPCDITDGMEKANLQSSPQLVSVSGNTDGLIEFASLENLLRLTTSVCQKQADAFSNKHLCSSHSVFRKKTFSSLTPNTTADQLPTHNILNCK